MKLAVSNIAWDKPHDLEMYRFLSEHGFHGLEIAPTRLFELKPYNKIKEAREFARRLQDHYALRVCSMQSLWYGRKERLFGTDEERAILLSYTKRAVDFASAIGCRNLVLGSPKNRYLDDPRNRCVAIEFLHTIADYAKNENCIIAFEPNPTEYGTNFVNSTNEAFALCEEVNSSGLTVNLDCGTVIMNHEKLAPIAQHAAKISHVHISEPFLKPLQRRELHYQLADLLEQEHYNGYVSVEMSGTKSIEEIKRAAKYVREVFV